MSLQESDQAAARVATKPRVALADIDAAVDYVHYLTADQAVPEGSPNHEALKTMTICLIVMKNGFVVIGKSAPASPENFDAELGRKFAHEDAFRQLWPLMGFALKDRLAVSATAPAA